MINRSRPTRRSRKSIRLRGWDYTTPGAYFITICTYQRQHLFDQPIFKEIVQNGWLAIPNQPHAEHVQLDEWIVMPNHLHAILILAPPVKWNLVKPAELPGNQTCPRLEPGSVGAIIGNFKSLTAQRLNNLRRKPGQPVWQRGYYDRIVRNERELNAIRQYIRDNPRRWAEDRDNLDRLISKMRYVP
jgi:REP element-mobilizing transposase RayT